MAKGHGETLRLLLEFGADLEARDENGLTALHHAASWSAIEGVRALILEHNANMFAVSKYGETPFDVAARQRNDAIVARRRNDEIVGCLLQLFGKKMTQEHGRHALHAVLTAAEYSFAEDDQFHPPLLPLRIRLQLGKLTLAQFRTVLHSLDAELIHTRDDSGKLPIHIACQMNAPVEVLTLLVELDPTTLQIADRKGSLPLHFFCCGIFTPPEYASARYLVEQSGVGTLDVRNRQDALPLHILCGSTNPPLRTVQYLIKSFSGAVTVRTDEGLCPFMVAACDTSSASLSVIYELVLANPNLIIQNVPAWYMS